MARSKKENVSIENFSSLILREKEQNYNSKDGQSLWWSNEQEICLDFVTEIPFSSSSAIDLKFNSKNIHEKEIHTRFIRQSPPQ